MSEVYVKDTCYGFDANLNYFTFSSTMWLRSRDVHVDISVYSLFSTRNGLHIKNKLPKSKCACLLSLMESASILYCGRVDLIFYFLSC